MTEPNLSLIIRAKKLGVLVRNARAAGGKTVEECAAAMGVSPAEFQAFEIGEQSPSLPQLELLAYYLNLPLEQFWGRSMLAVQPPKDDVNPQRLVQLRQRMIAVMLRKARLDAGLSLEDVAQKVGLPVDQMDVLEHGEKPVSMPVLETLSILYNRTVKDFQDRQGPVGTWMARQRAASGLSDMPENLASFISKPINRPYLELALRLSEMDVNKLRAVAEGLLEITL